MAFSEISDFIAIVRKSRPADETGASIREDCRLKAGCSQDWLPHREAANGVGVLRHYVCSRQAD